MTMILDGTNGVTFPATSTVQNAAIAAWVNFVGSTAVITASYNVTSITRSAAGKYTVNFTNALPDTKYAPIICATPDGSSTFTGAPQLYSTGGYTTTAPTTTSFLFSIPNNAYGAFVDPPYCSVLVVR